MNKIQGRTGDILFLVCVVAVVVAGITGLVQLYFAEGKAVSETKTVAEEVLTMPPGFILVTNQLGQWRAAYADSSCTLTPFPGEDDGTREQAISRARRQYEFLCDRDASLWIKAE